tara:strand:+ start:2411 stop:2803 length:393 start_codon:yes stop_codon:yes gene_type:complete
MKTLLTTILLLLPLSIQADFSDWEQKDKNLWYTYIALNVIDTGQTFDLIDKQRDPNYIHRFNLVETNPLLGKNPGKKELIMLKTATTALAFFILDKNPDHRTLTLGIMNGIYINTVYGNHEIGLKVKFRF